MILLSALNPLHIIGVGIVSLVVLLFTLRSYQVTNIASGLTSHIVSFVGYGVVFMYLWQTVGTYGSNSVWLAALMIATLVLFLAPLDYLFTPHSATARVQDAEDAVSPGNDTSSQGDDVQ